MLCLWERKLKLLERSHRTEFLGSKRLFYFLSANLCFYIPKFDIFSARWAHVILSISLLLEALKSSVWAGLEGERGEFGPGRERGERGRKD